MYMMLLSGCFQFPNQKEDSTPDTSVDSSTDSLTDSPADSGQTNCSDPKIDDYDQDGDGGVGVSCGGGSCTWIVQTNAPSGEISLSLIENGSPTFENAGWREDHHGFRVTETDGCNETKTLSLLVTTDFHDQVNDVSTLFDSQEEFSIVTVLVLVDAPSGGQSDCIAFGYDPSYFASECP